MAYNFSEPGVVGKVLGPNPGATPADDSDLHSAGANPYGNGLGSPPYDLARPIVYGQGKPSNNLVESDLVKQTPYDVAAPYFQNPPASGRNPYAQAVPTGQHEPGDRAAADSVAVGLDALYGHTLANYANSAANAEQLTPDSNPPDRPWAQDRGVDDQLLPPNQRR